MNKSDSIAALAAAMAQFQGEVIQPMKDKNNPFFKSKYVPLENVVEAIHKTAPKFGLSFIQYPINNENKVGVVTVIMHSSGEYIETEPIFAKPGKDDAQATGSVITYLKRYSLSAVFGITSDEDDDGNAGTYGNQQPQQQQQRPQQQAQQQQGQAQSQQSYNNIPMPKNAAEAASITITFGKHKGKTLRELFKEQPGYIKWLLENETTDKAIVEGIGMMQVAIAQQQAEKKEQQ